MTVTLKDCNKAIKEIYCANDTLNKLYDKLYDKNTGTYRYICEKRISEITAARNAYDAAIKNFLEVTQAYHDTFKQHRK